MTAPETGMDIPDMASTNADIQNDLQPYWSCRD